MSDFKSTLPGLADAFEALAKRASEVEKSLARQFTELECQVAAMRAAVEYARHRWIDKESMAIMDAALAGDAGKGWVSPEVHAEALKKERAAVLQDVDSRLAELYGRTGGLGSGADAYLAIFGMMRKMNSEQR